MLTTKQELPPLVIENVDAEEQAKLEKDAEEIEKKENTEKEKDEKMDTEQESEEKVVSPEQEQNEETEEERERFASNYSLSCYAVVPIVTVTYIHEVL